LEVAAVTVEELEKKIEHLYVEFARLSDEMASLREAMKGLVREFFVHREALKRHPLGNKER